MKRLFLLAVLLSIFGLAALADCDIDNSFMYCDPTVISCLYVFNADGSLQSQYCGPQCICIYIYPLVYSGEMARPAFTRAPKASTFSAAMTKGVVPSESTDKSGGIRSVNGPRSCSTGGALIKSGL